VLFVLYLSHFESLGKWSPWLCSHQLLDTCADSLLTPVFCLCLCAVTYRCMLAWL